MSPLGIGNLDCQCCDGECPTQVVDSAFWIEWCPSLDDRCQIIYATVFFDNPNNCGYEFGNRIIVLKFDRIDAETGDMIYRRFGLVEDGMTSELALGQIFYWSPNPINPADRRPYRRIHWQWWNKYEKTLWVDYVHDPPTGDVGEVTPLPKIKVNSVKSSCCPKAPIHIERSKIGTIRIWSVEELQTLRFRFLGSGADTAHFDDPFDPRVQCAPTFNVEKKSGTGAGYIPAVEETSGSIVTLARPYPPTRIDGYMIYAGPAGYVFDTRTYAGGLPVQDNDPPDARGLYRWQRRYGVLSIRGWSGGTCPQFGWLAQWELGGEPSVYATTDDGRTIFYPFANLPGDTHGSAYRMAARLKLPLLDRDPFTPLDVSIFEPPSDLPFNYPFEVQIFFDTLPTVPFTDSPCNLTGFHVEIAESS